MTITDFSLNSFGINIINRYVMLLPEIGAYGYHLMHDMSLYYIIDLDWNKLNDNMEFRTTKSPGCIY